MESNILDKYLVTENFKSITEEEQVKDINKKLFIIIKTELASDY